MSYAKRPNRRVKLGFPGLDDEFRGISPGELLMFTARAGAGKTNFVVNVMVNRLDTPQVFFSLEMPARLIFARLLAVHFDIPYRMIESGIQSGHPQVMAAIDAADEEFRNLLVCDSAELTEQGFRQYLRQAETMLGEKPRLISLDYLELFGLTNDNPTQGVNDSARALKRLAKHEDVAIVCLHQAKRMGSWEALDLTSARYGGEAQADYLFGAYRPGLDPELSVEEREMMQQDFLIQVLKNREGTGATLEWHYTLNPDTVRLELKQDRHRRAETGDDTDLGSVSTKKPADQNPGDAPASTLHPHQEALAWQ